MSVTGGTHEDCYGRTSIPSLETLSMKRFSCVRLLFVLLLPVTAFGQFDTAEVLGTVRDRTGAVIPQTAVTLTNESTGLSVKTMSDSVGNYNFFNVKAGTYTITAEQTGFSTFSSSKVIVNVGARQRVDVSMEVGVIAETV